ncbi:unnamed protein product, partial [Closterium sp. NIES-54]
QRVARVVRRTKETDVEVTIAIDGEGRCCSATGIPFLDHMMDQLASHGLLDVSVRAEGDVHIDDHHTNEDIGLALGSALAAALGDRKGIRRFGDFCAPLDEALIHVVLDLSGRPHLSFDVTMPTERVGTYDTQVPPSTALAPHSTLFLHVPSLPVCTQRLLLPLFPTSLPTLPTCILISPLPSCKPSILTILPLWCPYPLRPWWGRATPVGGAFLPVARQHQRHDTAHPPGDALHLFSTHACGVMTMCFLHHSCHAALCPIAQPCCALCLISLRTLSPPPVFSLPAVVHGTASGQQHAPYHRGHLQGLCQGAATGHGDRPAPCTLRAQVNYQPCPVNCEELICFTGNDSYPPKLAWATAAAQVRYHGSVEMPLHSHAASPPPSISATPCLFHHPLVPRECSLAREASIQARQDDHAGVFMSMSSVALIASARCTSALGPAKICIGAFHFGSLQHLSSPPSRLPKAPSLRLSPASPLVASRHDVHQTRRRQLADGRARSRLAFRSPAAASARRATAVRSCRASFNGFGRRSSRARDDRSHAQARAEGGMWQGEEGEERGRRDAGKSASGGAGPAWMGMGAGEGGARAGVGDAQRLLIGGAVLAAVTWLKFATEGHLGWLGDGALEGVAQLWVRRAARRT